jgi:RimJ/RimL family protein N-acetyltransferase
MTILTTTRLRLEPLSDIHLEAFNAMNSDAEVMRYLSGKPETLEESRSVVERVKARWAEVGYSWWAIVERESGALVGAGAIQNLRREATLLPDLACPLEIGWRLRRDQWGRGYAIEAAVAMADHAFGALHADELLAVCDPDNKASSGVMERLGMQPQGLRRWYGKELTTYRIDAASWRTHTRSGGLASPRAG